MNNKLRPGREVACCGVAAGVLVVLVCLGCGFQAEPRAPLAEPLPATPPEAALASAPSATEVTTSATFEEKIEEARRVAHRPLPPMISGRPFPERIHDPLPGGAIPALSDLIEEQRHPKFYVAYRYATETDRDEIEVRNSALLYTDLGPIDLAERQAQADPTASRPLDADEDLIQYQGVLSAPQIAALTKLLKEIAFLKLDESYGGPGSGERSDDEIFDVTLDGQHKKVVYRRHSAAEPMPEELVKLRTELFRLVHQKFRLNRETGSTP